MSGERYALFDRDTGRQIGRSFSSREDALRAKDRLRLRGKGAAPELVRHGPDAWQEKKREALR